MPWLSKIHALSSYYFHVSKILIAIKFRYVHIEVQTDYGFYPSKLNQQISLIYAS